MQMGSPKICASALGRASQGDVDAQRQLVALRVAYLNWAYANPRAELMAGNSNALSAVTGIPKGSLAALSA